MIPVTFSCQISQDHITNPKSNFIQMFSFSPPFFHFFYVPLAYFCSLINDNDDYDIDFVINFIPIIILQA